MIGPPWGINSFSSFIIFTIIFVNFFMWYYKRKHPALIQF